MTDESGPRTAREVWDRFSEQLGCVGSIVVLLGILAAAVFVVIFFSGDDGDGSSTPTSGSPTQTATSAGQDDGSPAATLPPSEPDGGSASGRFEALAPNDSDVRFGEANEVLLTVPASDGAVSGSFQLQWTFAANPETQFVFAGTLEGTYDAAAGTIESGLLTVTDETEGFLRFALAEGGTGSWDATVTDGLLSGTIRGSDVTLSFTVPLEP